MQIRNMSTRRWSLVGIAAIVALALSLTAGTGSAQPTQAQAPVSVSPPTIEGSLRDGQTLTAGNGSWSNNPTRYTYQWQRCDGGGQNCVNVPAATQRTFVLRPADVGRTVRVLVTAINAAGQATANSRPSAVVAGNAPPQSQTRPTISGTPAVGEELTANQGEFTNAPDRFTYQWQRCDVDGANCVSVAGATSQVYGVRSADLGRTLRVQVTARNDAGMTTATSDRTRVVQAAGGGATTTGTTTGTTTSSGGSGSAVSVSQVALPDRLIISRVAFIPSTIQSRTASFTARFRITDTRNRAVQGALVFAQGIPFGRVSTPAEQPTDANGFVQITFQPAAGLVFRQGASVVFFVRARKPGDNLLAGVSTRRLVQVRVTPR